MKNKKGFTLIEIIVCLVLISLIATISIVTIVKNKNNDKDKIIKNVLSAADVYYSMNSDIKNKLKENYGYLVITIDELKNMGMLDKNFKIPELSDEEKREGKSYDKMVIVDKGTINNFMLLSNDDDALLGYIDYIYPYEKNTPTILPIESVSIENFEGENFKCDSGLDNGIQYINENYEVTNITDYNCEYYKYDEDKDNYVGDKINKISNNSTKDIEKYMIEYKKDSNKIYRMLYVNPIPEFNIMIDGEKYEYSESTKWYNTNKVVTLEEKVKVYHKNYTYNDIKLELSDENHKIFNNKISYELCGFLDSSNCKKYDYDYNVGIETEIPNIIMEIKNNSAILTITDQYSGIKNEDNKYICENNNKCTLTLNDYNSLNEDYNITISDNALNTTIFYPKNMDIPQISITPIDITKFRITLTNNNNKTYNPILYAGFKNEKNSSFVYDDSELKSYKSYNYGYNIFDDSDLEYYNENYNIDSKTKEEDVTFDNTTEINNGNTITKEYIEIDTLDLIKRCYDDVRKGDYVCRAKINRSGFLNNPSVYYKLKIGNYVKEIKITIPVKLDENYSDLANIYYSQYSPHTTTLSKIDSSGNLYFYISTYYRESKPTGGYKHFGSSGYYKYDINLKQLSILQDDYEINYIQNSSLYSNNSENKIYTTVNAFSNYVRTWYKWARHTNKRNIVDNQGNYAYDTLNYLYSNGDNNIMFIKIDGVSGGVKYSKNNWSLRRILIGNVVEITE